MRRDGCQAMSAILLIGLLATALASGAHSPGSFRRRLQTLPRPPAPTRSLTYRAADSPATFSGLQDAPSTGTTGVVVGHYLSNDGLMASTPYSAGTQSGGQKTHSATSATGVWGQEISYSDENVDGDTRPDIFEDTTALIGITIDSVKFRQQNNVWMLDRAMGLAYKIDSSSSGSSTGSVSGIFQTSPGQLTPPKKPAAFDSSHVESWRASAVCCIGTEPYFSAAQMLLKSQFSSLSTLSVMLGCGSAPERIVHTPLQC